MKMHRLVVEVDGSPESQAAVTWCAEQAAEGDEVIVVAALSFFGEMALAIPADLDNAKADIRDALQHRWTEPLRARSVQYRTRLEDGKPWKAVLHVAEHEEADAIVVGQHRTSILAKIWDSPSERLIHHSEIPVIVVPFQP